MTKPPLLFVHGMWSAPHVWEWLKAQFEARGHVTHAPALPYHDLPPAVPPPPALGRLGLQDYVDHLVAEAATLPSAPVVVGHSMGGLLAQLVAAHIAAPALILLSPAPSATANVPALAPLRTVAGVVTRPGWWRKPTRPNRDQARWGIFNDVPSDVAERELDALVWDSGRALFQIAMPWLDGSHGARVDYDRLTMPALVVTGDRDRITPLGVARATARQLKGSVDYRELSGRGHWLFHDPAREQVARHMDEFLGRLPATVGGPPAVPAS